MTRKSRHADVICASTIHSMQLSCYPGQNLYAGIRKRTLRRRACACRLPAAASSSTSSTVSVHAAPVPARTLLQEWHHLHKRVTPRELSLMRTRACLLESTSPSVCGLGTGVRVVQGTLGAPGMARWRAHWHAGGGPFERRNKGRTRARIDFVYWFAIVCSTCRAAACLLLSLL